MFDRHGGFEPTTVVILSQSSELVRGIRATAAEDDRDIDLRAVEEPADALAFLDGREPDDRPRASFVLLDARGDVDGREFLETVADDRRFDRVPVVVLGDGVESGEQSESDSEVRAYYDRRANAYVPVPADHEPFADVLAQLVQFWISTARLPNQKDRV